MKTAVGLANQFYFRRNGILFVIFIFLKLTEVILINGYGS